MFRHCFSALVFLNRLTGGVASLFDRAPRLALLLPIAASLSLSASVNAANTVLFIDLNNASSEIAAVRAALPRASETRGARLIVVPSQRRFSEKRRAEILDVKQRFNALQERALDCTPAAGPAQCLPMWTALHALEVERTLLTGDYGLRELAEDIRAEFGGSPIAADRVIVSGHHSGGYFAGELARLEVSDLMQLDLQFPSLFRQARSVLLLGCDTGTHAMMAELFSPLFPSAIVIIGADSPAPVRDNTDNLRFIRAAIGAEDRLINASTAQDARRIFGDLRKQNWPVALYWQQRHYFSREFSAGAPSAHTSAVSPALPLRTSLRVQ